KVIDLSSAVAVPSSNYTRIAIREVALNDLVLAEEVSPIFPEDFCEGPALIYVLSEFLNPDAGKHGRCHLSPSIKIGSDQASKTTMVRHMKVFGEPCTLETQFPSLQTKIPEVSRLETVSLHHAGN